MEFHSVIDQVLLDHKDGQLTHDLQVNILMKGGAKDIYVAAAWQRYARVRVRITQDTKRSLVNQNG